MTNAKAWAGGITAALASVTMYFLDMWPPVAHMPPDVHAALSFIVAFAMTSVVVYLIPNAPKE